MRLLAMESDSVALDSLGAQNHTQGHAHALEDRPLLDVQLQVSRGVSTLDARFSDAVDVDMALA
jgi:hypothetical protein